MAHRKVKDLAVKVGEYNDRASGQAKARWHNVGAVMEDDNGGQYIMLDRYFNPAGVPNPDNRGTVLLSMFDQKEAAAGGGQRQAAPAAQQQQRPAPAQRPTGQQQRPAPQAAPQAAPAGSTFDDDVPF